MYIYRGFIGIMEKKMETTHTTNPEIQRTAAAGRQKVGEAIQGCASHGCLFDAGVQGLRFRV